MKVKELIEKLKNLNPELDLIVISENDISVSSGKVLEIENVGNGKAEFFRNPQNIAQIRFSNQGTDVAYLQITDDF